MGYEKSIRINIHINTIGTITLNGVKEITTHFTIYISMAQAAIQPLLTTYQAG